MRQRRSWSSRFALLTLLGAAPLPAQERNAETTRRNLPSPAYFGQNPPGEKPVRFAPAILAANPFLGRIAFSPDGLECFFTVGDATYTTMRLFQSRCVNGIWTPQVQAPFSVGFEKAGEPFFSPDGNRLYFTAKEKASATRMDFWTVARSGQGWGTPTRLGAPLNSGANDFCYSSVSDGTTYFLSNRSGSPQVYRARPRPDQPLTAELIPAPVLSPGTFEGDPCVPPDGRFLVFYSGRPGGFGYLDLYASFPDGKGEWTPPVNLGARFNTAAEEYGATLSSDGKYLFFVRHTQQQGELYWVAVSALDTFKP